MEDLDLGRLIYLVLLLGAVGFWVLVQNRQSLNSTLQQIAIWVFIFLGAIAAVGLWEDIRQTVLPQQTVHSAQGQITVPRSADGHYYLLLQVDGVPVHFLVDTGASAVVLTQQDAARAGFDLENLAYVGRAQTANGQVRTAPIWIDEMSLGGIVDQDLRASVNEGDMEQSLLGMSYLQRWSSIEIRNGALVLTR